MGHLKREQLAAMGIHYLYYPMDYMLDAQAAAGYKTVELFGAAPQFLIDYKGYQDAKEVRKKVEARGMTVCAFTPESAMYHYLMCGSDSGFHERSMEYFKQSIKAANELGAEKLLINCIGGTWDEEYKRIYERAVKSLQQLAPVAADYGVTIAVESVRPEESKVIITLPEVVRLLKDVNHLHVKACLDTVAMGVAGETPRQWFKALDKDIVHVHFTDGRPQNHLVWGDGLFPLEKYLDVLNEFGYESYLGQKITDGRYFDDPATADKRNLDAFKPYIKV